MQPPPRGCVLKLIAPVIKLPTASAAASARLCVETYGQGKVYLAERAAASARLCVETYINYLMHCNVMQPPPRGCVLKL